MRTLAVHATNCDNHVAYIGFVPFAFWLANGLCQNLVRESNLFNRLNHATCLSWKSVDLPMHQCGPPAHGTRGQTQVERWTDSSGNCAESDRLRKLNNVKSHEMCMRYNTKNSDENMHKSIFDSTQTTSRGYASSLTFRHTRLHFTGPCTRTTAPHTVPVATMMIQSRLQLRDCIQKPRTSRRWGVGGEWGDHVLAHTDTYMLTDTEKHISSPQKLLQASVKSRNSSAAGFKTDLPGKTHANCICIFQEIPKHLSIQKSMQTPSDLSQWLRQWTVRRRHTAAHHPRQHGQHLPNRSMVDEHQRLY